LTPWDLTHEAQLLAQVEEPVDLNGLRSQPGHLQDWAYSRERRRSFRLR
jgi:hypothetical protein